MELFNNVMSFVLLAQADAPPPPDSTAQVTKAWMGGVVGMMLLFGLFALVGYIFKKPVETGPAKGQL